MLITQLKGIGDKTGALFNKIGIYEAEDLITYYPRNYNQFKEPVHISSIKDEGVYTIYGMIATETSLTRHGSKQVVTTIIKDEEGNGIKAVWYNMPFLRNTLKRGYRFVFRGNVKHKMGSFNLEQPNIYSPADYNSIMNSMQPVYPLTAGLTNNAVIKAMHGMIDNYETEEYLPKDLIEDNEFISINDAIHQIHFPKDMTQCMIARKRIVFDEFFLFILALKNIKNDNENITNTYKIESSAITDEFLGGLPYELTNAQKNTIKQIRSDISGNKRMNRLVQGDVGSGKTVVALTAMLDTVFAGFQAAMMAPTEVLARQHYEGISSMLSSNESTSNIRVGLLVGSMSAAEKKKTHKKIAEGELDIIIGTNAVIQKNVEYKKLAMVITDEQHRFGVNQRRDFSLKGDEPHILVMSATPIPRTLAIIMYGDLDVSIINELPATRLPIKNCVVDENYRKKAYAFIEKEVGNGHQAYVICPLVEESENSEAENVVEYTEILRSELKGIRIEYLHGKMKASEKNLVMDEFSKGNIAVLVSTTVVEVGVNVPNATVMMIEDAQRFGLAQLHQLRGRVGRGSAQSYCIFINSKVSDKTKERLEIMNKSNDGFFIANEDLRLRGPGDFFGVRQSGEFDFALGDIYNDSDMLLLASKCVQCFMDGSYYMNKTEEDRLNKKVAEYTIKCLNKLNI